MKKRYIIAFIITIIILALSYKFWLIFKTPTSAKFDFYPFAIILILSYLGGLKLTDYLADFKEIKHQSRIEIVFLAIFFILLFIPMSHINMKDKSDYENRMLATYKPISRPDGGINYQYGNDFNSWFNDRFYLRNNLIFLADTKYLLNKYINTNKVLSGKNGWLFYQGEIVSVQGYQNINLFTQEELENIGKILSNIDEYCKQHNKHFYFVIAPDKSKIYGENYSYLINKINPDSKSKARQLISYLNQNTNVQVIYPYGILIENKNKNILYFKQDTHWNLLGAYYGYTDIIKRIQKDYKDIKGYEFTKYTEQESFGDIYAMLPEVLKPKTPDKYQIPDISEMRHSCIETENVRDVQICNNKSGKYKLTMFRDSFTTSLIPYLAESFRDSTYIWDYNFDIDKIKDSDVVMLEIVERSIPALNYIQIKGLE